MFVFNKMSSKLNCKAPNPLTTFCKQNELTRTEEDQCYIAQRDLESARPFSWRTYQHRPYGSKVVAPCYPGQFYNDGHIGGCNVDADSYVKLSPGFELTNNRTIQALPQLPVTPGRVKGWHSPEIESSLILSQPSFNQKPCNLNSERDFTKYRFDPFLFKHLCVDFQDPRFLIPELTHNQSFPRARNWHYAGEDTRQDRREKLRNNCDQNAKTYPPNFSYKSYGY
jgi:hypothetical protein